MADRGAAALTERLRTDGVRGHHVPGPGGDSSYVMHDSAELATAILGDRGLFLPDGLDSARLRTFIEQRFADQGFFRIGANKLIRSTIALAVDDILADLGVPMTDTVGGRTTETADD